MGGCGSNALEKLGPQFGRYVAAEKGKELVDLKVRELKENVAKQSTGFQQDTFARINDQQNHSLDKVKNTIADIDRQSPGTLDKAASLQRKTKESLLGADEIRGKYGELNQSVQNTFQVQQRKIFDEIDGVGLQQKRYLDSQRPSIPLYDKLPEAQKKKVFQQGEKKFADQIKQQQNLIQQQLDRNLNINRYTEQLRNVQSTIQLDNVSKSADSIISHAKGGLNSTSLFC